jgi:hypothetical protein
MAKDIEQAKSSLQRIQDFDTSTLPREAALGNENFADAVPDAEKIINLFRQFPVEHLDDLPANRLSEVKSHADGFFNLLTEITKFELKGGDPFARRQEILSRLKGQYQPIFDGLCNLISYASSRSRDFGAIERQARASMQAVTDDAARLTHELEEKQKEAERILADVRKVAAEAGVSQTAIYFQDESSAHDTAAKNWKHATITLSIILAVYAIGSATAHKWTWLAPTDTYSAFQLGLSKGLIFAVIAYMLLLAARNFLSHKHNAIVNKHRQNALLTYRTIADAANQNDARDIVLTHAAACIFAPQETGYIRSHGATQNEMPVGLIQTLPKLTGGAP